MFAVLHPSSLQNISDGQLLEEAMTFALEYQKNISRSFSIEILSVSSALRDKIKQVYSIREEADLLLIENHSVSASLSEVCTALLSFLTIPVMAASTESSFSNLE
jgi:hypothetical protein